MGSFLRSNLGCGRGGLARAGESVTKTWSGVYMSHIFLQTTDDIGPFWGSIASIINQYAATHWHVAHDIDIE